LVVEYEVVLADDCEEDESWVEELDHFAPEHCVEEFFLDDAKVHEEADYLEGEEEHTGHEEELPRPPLLVLLGFSEEEVAVEGDESCDEDYGEAEESGRKNVVHISFYPGILFKG